MSASPNKRPRLAGSFSPASPPYHLAKTAAEQTASAVQPDTPTSPPYMSTLPLANGDSSAIFNIQRSDASPTSFATMSQFSQAAGTTNTFPTPASTQARDGDGDVAMNDDLLSEAHKNNTDSTHWDSAHTRSDHNREGQLASAAAQKGMKFPFLLQKPINPSQPWHLSANLIHEYGLDALANRVRRSDPITGDKIEANKLRKSYKAILQNLRLPGKMEPVTQLGQFTDMYKMGEDWFNSDYVGDFDLTKGIDALPSLDKALKMDTVRLPPETEREFRKVIGADDSKKKAKFVADGVMKKLGNSTSATSGIAGPTAIGNSNSAQPSGVLSPSALRPTRPGTKRRYNDSSFKGYGEGYADDDLADSTAGEEDNRGGSSKKKRRKETYPTTGNGFLGPPGPGYNVGMVGGIRR